MPLSVRERVSYTIRMVVSHTLYYTGILQLILRTVLKGKAVVLMYHRVLTPDQRRATASQPGLVVEQATFARHIAELKRRFTVLTLDEFAERLDRRVPFDRPCCLITFDDGWLDNLQNALPILRAHGAPAVIFLPVHFIGGQRLFTREALTHLLVRAVGAARTDARLRESLRSRLASLQLDSVLDLGEGDPLAGVIAAMRQHRYAAGPEFEALVVSLGSELGVAESELSTTDTFIDWCQVDEMARQGVTFGGHGADHRVLTQVAPEVVQFEVATSKTVLDAKLAAPARAFAYPGGGWNDGIAATVQSLGYRLAFTIESGHVSCTDNPFGLRRVSIHDGMTRSTPMFLARLTGLF